jgi:hypothetical protein
MVWTAAAAILAGFVWWFASGYFQPKAVPGSIEYLTQEAARLNRSLPAQLDEKTELTVTEVAPAMFIYKYRLITASKDHLDDQNFARSAKPQLVQLACNRAETRDEFLNRGVTLRYSYFDKDKQHIATLDVAPADCGF